MTADHGGTTAPARIAVPKGTADPNAPAVLIAALSGRALAACARRGGYRPLVADLFGDLDTRELAEACERVPGSLARGFAHDALLARSTGWRRGGA